VVIVMAINWDSTIGLIIMFVGFFIVSIIFAGLIQYMVNGGF